MLTFLECHNCTMIDVYLIDGRDNEIIECHWCHTKDKQANYNNPPKEFLEAASSKPCL